MTSRSIVLAALLALVWTAAATAQVSILGGGCASRVGQPTVEGPLTRGSTMTVRTGCADSPGSMRFVLFGVALDRPAWVPVSLESPTGSFETCHVSVLPVLIGADFSTRREPIPIELPTDPIWSGFRLALQAYCIECGFAGCGESLTHGIEVTIR